jgi:hypothetical protein
MSVSLSGNATSEERRNYVERKITPAARIAHGHKLHRAASLEAQHNRGIYIIGESGRSGLLQKIRKTTVCRRLNTCHCFGYVVT